MLWCKPKKHKSAILLSKQKGVDGVNIISKSFNNNVFMVAATKKKWFKKIHNLILKKKTGDQIKRRLYKKKNKFKTKNRVNLVNLPRLTLFKENKKN